MAQKRYAPEIIAQAKRLFVHEGWGFDKVSDFFGGNPVAKTIENWAKEEDSNGKTWYDYREEYIESLVNTATPEMIQLKYQEKIFQILNDPNWSTKDSDALRKLQKDFASITDPGRQIPVMYSILEQLLGFLKKYHGELVTEEFLRAVTEFKNMKRESFLEA
nr:hypothetical protein 22 [Balneolaceae bacterium]